MTTPYYDPEKFGLRTIGEVEFSSGCYEFDTSVVWQDIETGALYVADDAGCSCPLPFESIGRGEMKRIERTQDLIDYFEERKTESYWYGDGDYEQDRRATVDGAIGELINKVREASR